MHVKRRSGFTLIELLVVVLIIGILAAIALPQYQKAVARARFAQVLTTLNALEKGIEMYRLQHRYGGSGKYGEELLATLDIEIPDITMCQGLSCRSSVGSWVVQWDLIGGAVTWIVVTIWTENPYSGNPSLVMREYPDGVGASGTGIWVKTCSSPSGDPIGKMLMAQVASQGWDCN